MQTQVESCSTVMDQRGEGLTPPEWGGTGNILTLLPAKRKLRRRQRHRCRHQAKASTYPMVSAAANFDANRVRSTSADPRTDDMSGLERFVRRMEVEQKDVIDDALDFTSEEYAVALGEKVCWGCDETAPYLGDGGPQPRKVAWSSLEKGHTGERETVDACCDGPRRGRRRDAEGGQTYKSWKRLWYSVHKDDPYNADQTYSMQEYRIRKKLQKRLQKDRFQSTHAGLTMVQDPRKDREHKGWEELTPPSVAPQAS